jgi:hypothetical protein
MVSSLFVVFLTLFKDDFRKKYRMVGWYIIDGQLEITWKKLVVAYSRYYSCFRLEVLGKTTKPLVSIDSVPVQYDTGTSRLQVQNINSSPACFGPFLPLLNAGN